METRFEIVFMLFLALYLVGRLCLGIYFTKNFNKAYEKQDLRRLRLLEKEFKEKGFLWWIYPVSITFLQKIEFAIQAIHQESERDMGIDTNFILQQAIDEYRNLNGLTTSEDDEEHA